MKKITLFLVALFTATMVFAEKIKISGIYDNFNNKIKTVELTYQYYSDSKNYIGVITSIAIPEKITCNATKYSVTSIEDDETFTKRVIINGIYYNLNDSNQTAEVTYQYYWDTNNYYGITSITIPEKVTYNATEYSVTSIGEAALGGCLYLTSITIPNSITSINKNAFNSCISLTSITINNGVTEIGEAAFNNCTSLKSITIPNSVTSINKGAFNKCTSLTSVTIDNGVTEIGDYAFASCTSLKSVTIPNSITNIGYGAFNSCTSLTEIIIPENVIKIGDYAFGACTSLTSVTINNGVTEIGEAAFAGCTSLKSVTIPNSITNIGYGAFNSCTSLTEIIIPENVIKIGDYAFGACSSLTSVTINNGVTEIGEAAFNNCTSLKSITIPNSITNIGYGAFYNCNKLRTIQIGKSIETIDENAFAGCTALYSIGVDAIIPPIIDPTTFTDVSRTAQIKVPCNAIAAYQASNYWNEFTNYIETPYSLIVISNDNTMGNAIVVKQPTCQDITAQVQAQALPGYEFVKWSDGFTENPHTIFVTSDTTITAEFRVASTQLENTLDNQTKIYTTNGTLHIEGATTDYHILDAAGRLIYSGNATTLTLPRGIYLVTINGEVEKIVL